MVNFLHHYQNSYLFEGINAQQCSDTDYVRAVYEASDLVWARYHDASLLMMMVMMMMMVIMIMTMMMMMMMMMFGHGIIF